jgi:sulfatase maturation enzyme AslB (radical SAM superfamily)
MASPDHLAVYLTNSCNLACSYCYVSVNQGPPVALSLEQIKRNVDHFLERVPGRAEGKKITLLGGEPFLNWKLFQDAARYARQRGGPDLVLQTFTNGTLLSPDKLDFLNEHRVFATISLDGRKEDNDRKRVYYRLKDRSVYEDVMRRLEGMDLSGLGVSLTFDTTSIEHLISNVDSFWRMGFGRVAFNPDLYENWTGERVAVLKTVMDAFRRYYRLVLDSPRPFQLQMLFSVIDDKSDQGWWHDCHNVVLGPDEKFYACDKALTFPVGEAKEQIVGDASKGMDWGARRETFDRAIEWLEKRDGKREETFCPMGVYFYAEHKGEDPAGIVDNFHLVSDAFADGLKALVADCQSHPAFQELYVRPRIV